MINLLLLAAWVLTGAALSVVFASPSDPRWSWTPMAAIFGPLWLAVALEQRAAALAPAPVPATQAVRGRHRGDGAAMAAHVTSAAPRQIEVAHAGSFR